MKPRLMWLIIKLLSVISFCKSEVLLMRRYDNSSAQLDLSCFYNGPQTESVGLGWILPNASRHIQESHERWKHSSRPGMVRGHFEYFGHIWISTTALLAKPPNVFPAVLDERWNDFPTIYTNGSSVFPEPIKFATDRVHISVRARSDAHIVLHSELSPYSSSSYWLALDQYGEPPSSSIRKCSRGIPRSLLPRFQDCKDIKTSHKGLDMLRQGDEWVHLTIQLVDLGFGGLTIKISLANPRDDSSRLLSSLTWTDPNPIRNLNYVSFRTHNTPGLWKIHDYRLVWHNGRGDGEGFNVFELSELHRSCLQLYYFFRPGFGNATVQTKDGSQVVELQATRNSWRMFKLHMDLKPPSDHIHFQPPRGNFEKTGPAFAFSQPFRVCGDDEFFVSRIKGLSPEEVYGAKCMDIKTSNFAQLRSTTSVTNSASACPETKFSKSCNITCGRAVGDSTCQGKVTCDKDSCSCLSGYKPTLLFNTTCQETIPTDIVTVPSPTELDLEEIDSVTEAVIDEDTPSPGEDGPVEEDIDGPAKADAHINNAVAGCNGSGGKDVTIIILALLLISSVVGGSLFLWHWRRRVLSGEQSFGVIWRGRREGVENNLIRDDDDMS